MIATHPSGCIHCGAPTGANASNGIRRRTCSDECSNRASAQRRIAALGARSLTRACVGCGQTYRPTDPRSRYCSTGCSRVQDRRRASARAKNRELRRTNDGTHMVRVETRAAEYAEARLRDQWALVRLPERTPERLEQMRADCVAWARRVCELPAVGAS